MNGEVDADLSHKISKGAGVMGVLVRSRSRGLSRDTKVEVLREM